MPPRAPKTQSVAVLQPSGTPAEKAKRGRKKTLVDPLTRSIRIERADWERLDRWASDNNCESCCEAVTEAIRQVTGG